MTMTMAGGYAAGRQYQQYVRSSVETADRYDLLLMLYRGAIRFLQRGILALRGADVPTAHASLVRVQDIVEELRSSLNFEAGDIATHLDRVYEYLQWRLVRANCEKDVAQAEEVLGILQGLLASWEVAVKSVRASESEQARRGGAAL